MKVPIKMSLHIIFFFSNFSSYLSVFSSTVHVILCNSKFVDRTSIMRQIDSIRYNFNIKRLRRF